MIRKLVALVLVLAASVAVAGFVVGVGPAPGGDTGTDLESFPTETPETGGTDSDSSVDGGGDTPASGDSTPVSEGATTTASPPFLFTIDRVERCGETCRDVTTTLTNEQPVAASDVQVYTRVYVGNGTDGDIVWEGTEPVGQLEPGESYTATKRVELSLSEGYAVKQHDGWITVQTTVESDGETMTFTQRRDVT